MATSFPIESHNPNISNKSIEKFKEFYYLLNNFYLKISYNNCDEIEMIIYDINLLDSIKYGITITTDELYEISGSFKVYDKIEDIYEIIIKLIEEKKYNIIKKEKDIIFEIIMSDILNNIKKVNIILDKIDENNEYIKILSKEIFNIKDNKIKNLIKENEYFKNEINKLRSEYERTKDEINGLKNIIMKISNDISNKENKIKNLFPENNKEEKTNSEIKKESEKDIIKNDNITKNINNNNSNLKDNLNCIKNTKTDLSFNKENCHINKIIQNKDEKEDKNNNKEENKVSLLKK